MRIKSIVTTSAFVVSLFAGAALAADQGTQRGGPWDTRGGAAEGMRGTPEQEARPAAPGARTSERGMEKSGMNKQQLSGMFKADELIGKNVVDAQGQDLGEIHNLVVSDKGQVEYIILSRGGVAGVGGDLVPVPWSAAKLKPGKDNDQVKASITKQQFSNAPAFDDENWAQISSPSYEQKVHSYFGTSQSSTPSKKNK